MNKHFTEYKYYIVVLFFLVSLLSSCKNEHSQSTLPTLPSDSYDVFAAGMDFSSLEDIGLVYTSVGDGNIFLRYEYIKNPNYTGFPLKISPTFTFTKGNTGTYYINDIKLVPLDGSTGFTIEGLEGNLEPGNPYYEKLISLMGHEITIRNVLEDGTENFSHQLQIPPLTQPLELETTPSPYGPTFLPSIKRNSVVTIGKSNSPLRDVVLIVSHSDINSTANIYRAIMYKNAGNKLQLTPEIFEGIPKEGTVSLQVQAADAIMLTGKNEHSYFLASFLQGKLPYVLLE